VLATRVEEPAALLRPDPVRFVQRQRVPPRIDEPTALMRTVPVRATDLWDDLLYLGQPATDDTIEAPIRRWAHVLVPAALTCLLAAIGLGRPGLWTDELATWGMATTPWSQFWPVLRYVDAVLAPYYVFMHGWVDLFGSSDVSLRTPSLLAMTAAAGLIGAIGNRLAGRATGVLAGIVFALLASTSRFAAEARPYALTVAVACLATWLLLHAWARPTLFRWMAYGLSIAVLSWLHLVAVLLIAAHAWTVLAWRRALWWRFGLAAVAGTATSVAIVFYGLAQRHQVAYIAGVGLGTAVPYSEVLFGGVAIAVLLLLLGLFGLPLRYPSAVFVAWAILPTVALVVVSTALPMFLPRYLIYTTPGWALAAGVTLARFRRPWAIGVLALLVVLAGPAYLQMRGPDGHGQGTRELAQIIGREVKAGDGLVYADDEPIGSWTARDAIAHYLPAAYRPRDLLAVHPQRTGGVLLATECPDIEACLNDTQRLWVVRAAALSDPLAGIGPSKEDLLRAQYQVDRVWHLNGLTVALLERKPPQTMEGTPHA
jgi:mannosyltransferase